MADNTIPGYRDPHRWVVFSVCSLIYFFVYFHRVTTSVIVSDLLAAFHTNATALGFMSSMYFYLYAGVQPVVGYLSDRLGPRRVIGYWSLVAAAGCFLFGLAPTVGWASVGRALIGFGVGGVYVPTVKAISQWFRKGEFTTMLGCFMAIGNVGAVVATTPLALATDTWGWRSTFFLIGGITLGLALTALWFTRDAAPVDPGIPEESFPLPEKTGGLGASIIRVLSSGQFWLAGLIFFGLYGTLVTLQGLWATPFLMTVFGIERMLASKLNMIIPIGVIIGAPLFGWLTDRFSLDKRNILIGIVALYTLTWVAVTFLFSVLGMTGLSLVLLIMGAATGGFISVLWGLIRENTPADIMGLTSGLLNPAPFLGVAVFQVITGAILDRARRVGDLYPVSGFQNAFLLCLVACGICLALSFLLRRKHRNA